MSNTNNPQIAQTIINQLGRGALYMLGAKDLLDLGNGLQFRIRGSRKANTIMIELDQGADLYNVRILKIGRAPSYKITEVANVSGLFADQLRPVIEQNTGLYMSL
jgi:hypothetical protein